jgi:gluconolactonase
MVEVEEVWGMKVIVKSASVSELIDGDAPLERVATGFSFTEGPVWHPVERCLLFSDIPADVIYRWEAATGITEFRRPSEMSNGLTLDGHLRLIACHHATSRVTRTEADGRVVALATHWQGKELNSPNDVVVRSDGSIYFTDPAYGRRAPHGVPREQELDFQGVYRIDPQGELHLAAAGDYPAPNGLCFSPGELLLYVNDSVLGHIRRFSVRPDGSLEGGEVWFTEEGAGPEGVPDGMKCDERGNVWVCGPRGIWIVSPEGEHLGVIEIPETAANLTWGGDDWHELFITATSSVYRIRTRVGPNHVPYMV